MSQNIEKYLKDTFNVSRETFQKLEQFCNFLKIKNSEFNLIGKSTIDNLWERHIIDSLQLTKYIDKQDILVDFGSGAGLPGLVLSIMGYKVISVEAIAKKCNFQTEVKDLLGLTIEIVNDRIEKFHVKHNNYVLTARAVASLEKLFFLSHKHLTKAKRALFMKGKNYREEIIDAEKFWKFKYKTFKSITSDESVIIEITNLQWK